MAKDFTFSDEQAADWQRAQEALRKHPCKCGVCAANLYLKIRAEKTVTSPARKA